MFYVSSVYQITVNQVKLQSGSETLLPEGMEFAAHPRLLFVASFDRDLGAIGF